MLLLIGFTTLISVRACCGVLVVTPQGNPVYFPVGVPATISCTVKAVSGNVWDSYSIVQLSNGTSWYSSNVLGCSARESDPLTAQMYSPLLGNVSLSRSYPDQSTLTCSYTLPLIRDSTYTCFAISAMVNGEEQRFDVVTIKKPNLYINNGQTEISANEGDSLVVTCVALNSKPAYSVNWDASNISSAGTTLTSQSSNNGYTNSSASLTVTASAAMNGRRLTCTASSFIPALENVSASVILNINYGPLGSAPSVVEAQANFIIIECSMLSNPVIQSYAWSLNYSPLNCTTRFCNVSSPGSKFSIVICKGRNAKTGVEIPLNITVKWPYTEKFSSLESEGEKKNNLPLTIGIAVGVVVIVVIAIALTITIKRRRALNRSAPERNDRVTNVKDAAHSTDRSGEDMRIKAHGHPGQTKADHCDNDNTRQAAGCGQSSRGPVVGQVKSRHNPGGGKSATKSAKKLQGGLSQHSRH